MIDTALSEHELLERLAGRTADCYDRTVAVLIEGRGNIDKWVLYGVLDPDRRNGEDGQKRIIQTGRWINGEFGGCEIHHDEKRKADEAFQEKEGWG